MPTLRECVSAYGAMVNLPAADPIPDLVAADVAEYYRLFVGPAAPVAAPYESVYRNTERLLMQGETEVVRKFYRTYDYLVRPPGGEPDDYLPVELAFYCTLQQEMLRAYQNHDPGETRRYLAGQRLFFQQHLVNWVPTFCAAVAEGSRSAFYRAVARQTALVIGAEETALGACASVLSPAGEGPGC